MNLNSVELYGKKSENLHKYCVILGCGESVNDLSEEEVNWLNNCYVRIGINKYTAFYKKARVVPSHVYFTDIFSVASRDYLKHIFDIVRNDGLYVTLILNARSKLRSSKSKVLYLFNKVAYYLPSIFLNRFRSVFFLPKQANVDFIRYQKWDDSDNKWASSLSKPLFHFRGSLSTVFNYVSIKYPEMPIMLIGVDFNNSNYFFEEELKNSTLEHEDWTTKLSKKSGKHFSVLPFKGQTMLDKMPYMIKMLNKSGNLLFSNNSESLLVKKGYAALLDIQNLIE